MEITSEQKRENIIHKTIQAIDECGIDNVSTREIAKRAGISVGTIFHYFSKKEDLIISVLNRFSMYDKDIFNTARLKNMDFKQSIEFFIQSYCTYYENYPEIVSIYQAYYVKWKEVRIKNKISSIHFNRIKFIKEIIEKAEKEGVIEEVNDTDLIVDMVDFIIKGICLKWRMCNYSFSLRQRIEETINILLKI